jgi:uncharacterized membrane protein
MQTAGRTTGSTRVENASRHILENVEAVSTLYQRAEKEVDWHQRGVESVGALLGRPRFLYLTIVGIAIWVTLNVVGPMLGVRTPDAPPFYWLQGSLGLCALLMTTVVLITQNRQGKLDEQRAHLDLQVNLLAEKKIAKLISLVEELRRDIPSVKNRYDAEAEAMGKPADPHFVARAIEEKTEP